MRRLVPLLVLTAACNAAADRLVGSWEFDPATYELIPRYRRLSPEEQKHWVETARMDLTFTKDTVLWEQGLPGWGSRTARGAYVVAETKGNRVTVDAFMEGKPERFVFSVDEKRLRFGLGGRSIILKRRAGG